MDKVFYLKIGDDIVGSGSEADMVNLAAQYDSDYELLEEEDLTADDRESPFFTRGTEE